LGGGVIKTGKKKLKRKITDKNNKINNTDGG
jgi:hypothetical protein